ncbi:MAG: hypothetical protein U9R15_01450 [Chloroflexota bacterium]|nr:hypothetical protein [Chloroflexota bacterium]
MENNYTIVAQKAFETILMGAGRRISSKELAEIIDAASRNAVWYAEREDVLYRHLTLCETRPLKGWFQYWHENDYVTLFRQWVCMNLDRASEDPVLFGLTEEDAQIMAVSMGIKPLTDDEMRRVKKGLNAGLEGYQEIMATAITEAVEEP